MANTIKIKRSSVSGKVPTTLQLELGELAVNTHDGKLYTKKDDGTAAVVQIGDAASTADALSTARSIALSGDVSGSTSFDGSANVTITATVADDSHNHVISNVDGLQTALDAKAPLASPTFTGTPAAPTAAAGTNTTQVATTAFVSSAVANVVDAAPGALDTLNELAAALGDDANFSTTVTNSIATKLPLAGGQMTGNITFSGSQTVDGRDLSVDGAKLDGIEAGATADQTASEILTAIKTVDGSGSGLDADTVDGVQASSFIRSDTQDSVTGPIEFSAGTLQTYDPTSGTTGSDTATDVAIALGSGHRIVGHTTGYIRSLLEWTSGGDITIGQGNTSLISGINFLSGSSATNVKVNGNRILTVADEGSGNGIDADTVDGVQASSFLRADASDTATQRIAFYANNTNSWDTIATATGSLGGIEIYNSGASTDAFMAFHVGNDYACYFGLDGGTNKLSVGGWSMGANSYAIYHEGNKPTLSELGYTGDTNANYITNNNQLTNGAGYITSSGSITGNAATATTLQTARTINGTSFNGSANITITANTSNTLSRGSYLTGSNFNGSAATTWAVDATTSSTASKIVARDGSGHIRGNYIFGAYLNMSHSQATRSSDTIFYSSTDAYLRKNTASGMRSSLSVPHLAGNNTFTLAQRGQVDALSSASTITPNFNNSNNFSISLSTNTTIANPSNLTAGQSGAIAITYNGGYTVAFGSYWKFPGGTAPTATSTSGKTDVLVYYVESSTRISAQLILNTGG